MTDHLSFLLGFCFLLTHEMDAIRCKEWRIFPITSKMEDDRGYLAFTAFHIPLYAVLLWGFFDGVGLNRKLVFGLDAFFIIHVFLHIIFINHSENRFKTGFSWVLILGAGVCGMADLLFS